jgi:hypothetical protein
VPATETRILNALDREGMLDKQIFVVGTNALSAYELMTGVLLSSDLLATKDMDLLWDHRPRLSLVVTEIETRGVPGMHEAEEPRNCQRRKARPA